MFEVSVISDGANVASGKTAYQSTTLVTQSGKQFSASLAVDGDANSFSHTNNLSPWWMVDLSGSFPIDSVSITNRWCQSPSDVQGCLCRLSNATVSLLDNNDSVIATSLTNNTCGILQIDLEFPASCPTTPPSSSPINVCLPNTRKIKLQQSTNGTYIHIFELQALSSLGINVAQGKSASQSSTYVTPASGESFPASLAIDGNTNTFSHTKDSNAWLEVDLGSSFDISSLNILNRWCKSTSDPWNCLCRLSNTTLSLIDDSDSVIVSKTIGDTCGRLALEYAFEAASQFCQTSAVVSC
jgi:hypothetical protein